VWDSTWGQLPSKSFQLIPQTLLWNTNCSEMAPEIVTEPEVETVEAGSAAVFEVEAQGTEPMTYQWLRGGLPLTDDGRITGSASPTLSIAAAQASDGGGYSVNVSNPYGLTNSVVAQLYVFTGTNLIVNGSFENGIAPWSVYPNPPPIGTNPGIYPGASGVNQVAEDGIYYAALDAGAGVLQTITVPSNGTYELTWYDNTADEGFSSTAEYTVAFSQEGVTVASQFFSTPHYADGSDEDDWQQQTWVLDLGAGEYVLSFVGTEPFGYFSPDIDNVVLQPVN
jgi:hypothetical protein